MLKTQLSAELASYCLANGVREDAVLRQLREKTQQLSRHQMQITPDQGAFMALIAQLMNAKNYLEIGIYTGYSTLWLALHLPEDAKITALDISNKHLELASAHWRLAGVAAKITTMIAPASDSLAELEATRTGFYDIAFIDANKSAYIDYYEACLNLVRPGGLIIIDNVLMYGQVLDKQAKKSYVKVLQRLNDLLIADPRVTMCMLAIGDGMTLARKKG